MTAHAGEEGPPDYVRDALACGVEWIDHGYTAAADADLVAHLATGEIPVTMCPLSNLRLQVTDDLTNYPLRLLLDAEVPVSINSDDPPYIGSNLNQNYAAVTDALHLDRTDLVQLARNSFTGSFAPREIITANIRTLSP